ncbi:hypothetical protein ASF57_22295 [Methylobacterium sp. Leaf117]|nr:hypothetical protein ASF57_22295 [Methylobacterium sp. Leaf117]
MTQRRRLFPSSIYRTIALACPLTGKTEQIPVPWVCTMHLSVLTMSGREWVSSLRGLLRPIQL